MKAEASECSAVVSTASTGGVSPPLFHCKRSDTNNVHCVSVLFVAQRPTAQAHPRSGASDKDDFSLGCPLDALQCDHAWAGLVRQGRLILCRNVLCDQHAATLRIRTLICQSRKHLFWFRLRSFCSIGRLFGFLLFRYSILVRVVVNYSRIW